MTQFDTSYTTSYQSTIVNIAPHRTILEILEVEEYRDLEISHSPCEFMYDLYIGEIFRPAAIFLLLIVWASLHSLLHSELLKKLYLDIG